MGKFYVPQVATLAFVETYGGEFTGWIERPILADEGGTLVVPDWRDQSVNNAYRRDELEAYGRACPINADGPAAFAPGQWNVVLDHRGRVVDFIPCPKGEPEPELESE